MSIRCRLNRIYEIISGDDDWDNDDDQVLVSENLLTLSPSRMNQSNSVSNDDADNDSDISSLDINWPSKPFESPTTFVEEKVCLGKTNKVTHLKHYLDLKHLESISGMILW